MLAYVVRRLLLMIPTILGIMAVSFAIVQFVPGGPVERAIAQLQGADQSSTAGFGGGGGQIGAGGSQAVGDIASRYRGSQGLDPKFIQANSRSNTASTSRRSSASGSWCATTPPSTSARATTATRRC